MSKIIVTDDLYGFMSKQYDADGIAFYENDEAVIKELVRYFKSKHFEVAVMEEK